MKTSNVSICTNDKIKYDDDYIYRKNGSTYSIYTKDIDDLENFKCQVTEIHLYDSAEYAWAEKDSLTNVIIYKENKIVDRIKVSRYNSDNYKDNKHYLATVIDVIIERLYEFNKDVKPKLDYIRYIEEGDSY